MKRVVLAVDQGTTTTKALLVDAGTGEVLGAGSAPVGISLGQPGWVEQDARDIWRTVEQAVAACFADGTVRPSEVAGVAISSQRESVVAWDAVTGEPRGPVLGWQDSRTAVWCASIAEHADEVRSLTGLPLDAMYSAPKMRWLLQHAAADGGTGALRVGTVDSWLVFQLTGEHVIEAGNASRTLLLDLDDAAWHPDLLDLFEIPASALPQVRPSSDLRATVRDGVLGLGAIPVAAVLADSHAALFHHGQGRVGTAKATYGTGSSVMAPASARIGATHGVTSTIAWELSTARAPARPGRVQLAGEGNVLTSGAGLDWVARMLGAPDGIPGGAFVTDLAATEPDAAGVAFVPAFTGLGAPYWDRDAVGTLTGVTGGTSRGHIARAALEAVAHQVADVVEAIVADGVAPLERLVADGGATASDLLMQLQADLLGRPVQVAASPHASALGAADLAAQVLTGAIPPAAPPRATFHPRIDDAERAARRGAWAEAVTRSRGIALGRHQN